MASSHKKNKSQNKSSTKIISSFKNIYKTSSFYKHKKNLDSPRNHYFPLIGKTNLKFDIEWKEREIEIFFIAGRFENFRKLYKKTEKLFIYHRLNKIKKLKFKVDGKLNINSVFLIYNNNINNNSKDNNQILFLFNDIKSQSLSTKDSSPLISNRKCNFNNQISSNELIDFSFSKKNYCNYYPKREEMRQFADKKPTNFPVECYHGISHIQNEIGNKIFLNLIENSSYYNNDSYKIIAKKDHIILNHFCYKNINKKVVISFVVKYRHKNTTFVYYK